MYRIVCHLSNHIQIHLHIQGYLLQIHNLLHFHPLHDGYVKDKNDDPTHGTDDNDEDCIFKGENIELVSGFECASRGDLLCDTPADPNLKQGSLVNSEDSLANDESLKLATSCHLILVDPVPLDLS